MLIDYWALNFLSNKFINFKFCVYQVQRPYFILFLGISPKTFNLVFNPSLKYSFFFLSKKINLLLVYKIGVDTLNPKTDPSGQNRPNWLVEVIFNQSRLRFVRPTDNPISNPNFLPRLSPFHLFLILPSSFPHSLPPPLPHFFFATFSYSPPCISLRLPLRRATRTTSDRKLLLFLIFLFFNFFNSGSVNFFFYKNKIETDWTDQRRLWTRSVDVCLAEKSTMTDRCSPYY